MSKLWGSRFAKKTDALADNFTFSISYDQRLAKYDVLGSIAHARMLGKCGIIPKNDAAKIASGLQRIARQIETGKFKINLKEEDIHSHIQTSLKKLIGPAADKLHTARSRNDQVVLDVKMYCKDEIKNIYKVIKDCQKSICIFANKNRNVIIPAYTHLQSAQVVLLAHHMLAYIEMLDRDFSRFQGTFKRLDVLPLGSCALSGTSLATDRNFLAKQLGFSQVGANSMDAVSSRDFACEIISDCAILGMHCSRIAEDLILWTTQEFDFVDIDWAYCTGSSIMPHKKNPDVLELIRGSTAQLQGNLTQILSLMKGLPLTYNRDMQLDKPPLFSSVDLIKQMLGLLSKIFLSLKVNQSSIDEKIYNEALFSVDLVEYLIRKGVSYREAHDTIGRIVLECLDKGFSLADLEEKELKKYSKHFSLDVVKLLNPASSVKIKKSAGSTNPQLVAGQLNKWKKYLHA